MSLLFWYLIIGVLIGLILYWAKTGERKRLKTESKKTGIPVIVYVGGLIIACAIAWPYAVYTAIREMVNKEKKEGSK